MDNKEMIGLNPWYITGFVDGEGCFWLGVVSDKQQRNGYAKIYYRWRVSFVINLREDDQGILSRFKEYFGVGNLNITKSAKNRRQFANYAIMNPFELKEVIVPHFEMYPLQAKKADDFILWKEAVEIICKVKERNMANGIARQVYYTDEENLRLVEIFKALKRRTTGDRSLVRSYELLNSTNKLVIN